MLTLTAAIAIPNIQKVHVDAVQLDSNSNTGVVTCSAQGGGALIYGVYTLTIKDGPAQGLRATVTPTGFTDRVEVFTSTVPTAFTDLVTAYGTAGNVGAKNRAVETMLQAAGLLPAGTIA
jgi:hypothetical protein